MQWNIFVDLFFGGGSIGKKILHSSKYKLFKLNGYECRKRFSENVLHKLNGTVFGLLLWRLSSRKQKKIHGMQVVTDNNKFPRLHFPILVVTSRKVHVKKKIRVIFSFIWLKNRDEIYLNSRCLPMHEYHQGLTMINICIFYFKIFECV